MKLQIYSYTNDCHKLDIARGLSEGADWNQKYAESTGMDRYDFLDFFLSFRSQDFLQIWVWPDLVIMSELRVSKEARIWPKCVTHVTRSDSNYFRIRNPKSGSDQTFWLIFVEIHGF